MHCHPTVFSFIVYPISMHACVDMHKSHYHKQKQGRNSKYYFPLPAFKYNFKTTCNDCNILVRSQFPFLLIN